MSEKLESKKAELNKVNDAIKQHVEVIQKLQGELQQLQLYGVRLTGQLDVLQELEPETTPQQ